MSSWQDSLYRDYATNTGRTNPSFTTGRQPVTTWLIDRYFPSRTDARIADLGCGSGGLLHALSKRGYSCATGVDISEEQVRLASEHGVQNVICQGLDDYLSGAGPHDFIVMLDVLEHFDRQGVMDLLTAIHAATIDEGRILLRVPNAAGFLSGGVCFGDFTHVSLFTAGSIAQVLKSAGFRVVRCDNEPLVYEGLKPFVRALAFRAFAGAFCMVKKLQIGFQEPVIHTANLLVLAEKVPAVAPPQNRA